MTQEGNHDNRATGGCSVVESAVQNGMSGASNGPRLRAWSHDDIIVLGRCFAAPHQPAAVCQSTNLGFITFYHILGCWLARQSVMMWAIKLLAQPALVSAVCSACECGGLRVAAASQPDGLIVLGPPLGDNKRLSSAEELTQVAQLVERVQVSRAPQGTADPQACPHKHSCSQAVC